jgi:hypothetical protein
MFFSPSIHRLSASLCISCFCGTVAFSQHAKSIAPVPSDPLELVTTPPETVETSQKSATFALLLGSTPHVNAFGPYVLTVTFNVLGSGQYTGPGDMQETSDSNGARRWTGKLGAFTITRILTTGAFDSGWQGPIPMRIHTSRQTMLAPVKNGLPPFMRLAQVGYQGAPLTCILSSTEKTTAPARDWSEAEYCIDASSGMLRIYSERPGIYVLYNYDNSATFHGRLMPSAITVYEAGKPVMQETITVKDATSLDESLFQPTSEMITTGVMMGPTVDMVQRNPATASLSAVTPVVVHATLSADGQVVEAEALQNSSLAQAAVQLVRATQYGPAYNKGTPVQREAYVTVE